LYQLKEHVLFSRVLECQIRKENSSICLLETNPSEDFEVVFNAANPLNPEGKNFSFNFQLRKVGNKQQLLKLILLLYSTC